MSPTAQAHGDPADGTRFIDPQVLARIGNLALVARTVVDGYLSGLHRAVHLGVSTEFAQHRAYTPGDDVRRVDWRLYARSDRLYVKQFEMETNLDLVLAIDVSRSMDFATGTVTKLDYARMIAASLAELGARQRDRVGLLAFDSELTEVVTPSARHRERVLSTLERARALRAGDLSRALREAGELLRRRGLVVVISDFYEPAADAAVALQGLALRGHDVIAVQVLDPGERELAPGEGTVLEDLESGERLPVVPGALRAEYRSLIDGHVAELGRECGARGVDHACFDTAQPLDHLLHHYLSERARLARVR